MGGPICAWPTSRRRSGVLLDRGALPVVLGGDHSVPIPILRAFDDRGGEPICVVQIDAHLDFVDERFGVREGHGNVMRRIAELDSVAALAQIGIRGPGSSDPQDFEDARRHGQHDHRSRASCAGSAWTPTSPGSRTPPATTSRSTATGSTRRSCRATARPSPGGLTYHEVVDLLRGVATKGDVVGLRLRRGRAPVRPDRGDAADRRARDPRLPRGDLQGRASRRACRVGSRPSRSPGAASRTGQLGVAVSTADVGAGRLVAWARPGVGAVAMQSWPNLVRRDRRARPAREPAMTRKRRSPTALARRPRPRRSRQVGVVDATAAPSSWTGEECTPVGRPRHGRRLRGPGQHAGRRRDRVGLADTFAAACGRRISPSGS